MKQMKPARVTYCWLLPPSAVHPDQAAEKERQRISEHNVATETMAMALDRITVLITLW